MNNELASTDNASILRRNIMTIQKEIIGWLHGRPDWLQEAAIRILNKDVLSNIDLDELSALCKTEAGQQKTKTRIFPGLIDD